MKGTFFLMLIFAVLVSFLVLAQEVVDSKDSEIRTISNDENYCRAWLQQNSVGEECAYGGCYMNNLKVDTTINCKSTIPDDVPENVRMSGEPCNVTYDKDNDGCLVLRCPGYSKHICVDSYSEPKKEETKTVLFRNPKTVISNTLYASQTFYGLKIKADALADYYDTIGDAENSNKYNSIASQFLEVSNMIDSLRTKLIGKTRGVKDINDLSDAGKKEIISDVIKIEGKINQIRKDIYG